MKSALKKIGYILLPSVIFAYGLVVGLYGIFPYQQLLAIKHYVEFSSGTFESQEQTAVPGSTEVYETFLQRLLIKKIQIPGFSGHGGGISTSGNLLYIVTNKGSVQVYNFADYTKVESDIADLPMNFSGLIESGHPYKNDFRINWFRVNGIYSEAIDTNTHLLVISHNGYDQDRDCITHNISRTELKLNNTTVSQVNNWQTIFTATPCIDPVPDNLASATPYPGHISGGAIAKYDEQNLLITVGDYNRNGIEGTEEYAMDSSNPYGKFILLDKNSGDWSVYAVGSRNASGLYIDKNSVIWSVENGPNGGDELNIIEKGKSYGWPKVSLGIWYDPSFKLPGDSKTGTHPGYQKPVFSWVPSVAPSSLIKIEGQKFKQWQGDLIMATMRDQSLHRLRLDEDNRVIYNERIPLEHRIRDLTTLPDGRIALITDDAYLIMIEDGGPVFQEIDTDARKRIAVLDNFDKFNTENGIVSKVTDRSSMVIYDQHCASCHNLNPTNQIGPHLHELFNRQVGDVANFNYSQTLKSDKRNWNAQLLKSFLLNPEEEFHGTRMQKINMSSSELESLIQFFQVRNYQTDTSTAIGNRN